MTHARGSPTLPVLSHVLLVFVVGGLIAGRAGPTDARQRTSLAERLVFVVTQDEDVKTRVVLDPIAIVRDERTEAFALSSVPENWNKQFGEVYGPGTRLRLFSGGKSSGEVRPVGPTGIGCMTSSVPASGQLTGGSKLTDGVGIATSLRTVRALPLNREKPHRGEENALLQTARQILIAKHVPANALDQMTTRQSIAYRRADGAAWLFGSFQVLVEASDRYLDDNLFLVFEPESADHHPSHQLYRHATDDKDGKDDVLVDLIDLDGDGFPELVIRSSGYEDHSYRVLAKRGRHWRLLATGGGGC